MQIKKITCIQLSGEFPDIVFRTVMPDYGMPLIGTVLSAAGYDVKVYIEHIEPPEWNRIANSDLVCFSSLCAGAEKTYQLASRIRRQLHIPVVIGGTHATYFPESSLEHCDYVVFGEGDDTILELVRILESDADPAEVAGIAYLCDGRMRRTRERARPPGFDIIPDYSLIQGFRRLSWLDVIRERRTMWIPVQSSRGCHFKCKFCIVNTMYPSGYRKRDIESVIRDLRDKRRYGRELLFVDNDFAADRASTKRLLRRMIEEDFDFNILVFARVEIARDDELLSLMRLARVTQVYQGYESVQPETLDAYNKHQTLGHIMAAIEKLHAHGLRVAGSFVVGADTDTVESIRRTVDFAIEQRLEVAYFFPIWGHFPEQINGYQTIVPWYRSIFRAWKYCDGNFVTHFPMNMPPSKLQRSIVEAYRRIYSRTRALDALRRGAWWEARWKTIHHFLWHEIERAIVADHIPFLEAIEGGLYDSGGRLREDLLAERVRRDPRWTFQEGNRAIRSLGLSPLELPIPRERNITCMPAKSSSGCQAD
jgi:anaerobic magnesium-protoporphyrin IX monomethyl ester cyclase